MSTNVWFIVGMGYFFAVAAMLSWAARQGKDTLRSCSIALVVYSVLGLLLIGMIAHIVSILQK